MATGAARAGESRRIMPPMKKLSWIVLVVALVACSKKSDEAGKGGAAAAGAGGGGNTADCATAAAKAVASLGPGADASGMKEKLQAIYATRCTEDRWPAEVVKCYEEAAGMQGLTACRGKLPPELGTKLRGEIMSTMAAAAAAGGQAPAGHGGAAPAPAGDPAAGAAGPAGGSAAAPAK
jgi:hypothetical protein